MLRALKRLEKMPENKINMLDPDAPEIENWEAAIKGKFYRPVKKLISIRLDFDVLDWFKHVSTKYQPLINRACREYMERHRKMRTYISRHAK